MSNTKKSVALPVSPRKKKLQALDRKVIHDVRNQGMKAFGQYFMFFMNEMGVDADAANQVAMRQVVTIMEEVAAEMCSKAEYEPKG
jgi:hypothetical protein